MKGDDSETPEVFSSITVLKTDFLNYTNDELHAFSNL